MGAPKGNLNAAKNLPWRDALNRALSRHAEGNKQTSLNIIADQVVSAAINGERWAIEEIGNRVDGKPKQQTEITGSDGGPLEIIRRGVSPQS